MSAQELSASRFVDLCLGVVVSEISSYLTHTHTHTHTLYFLNISLTTFLFTPPSILTRFRHEPERPTFVVFCSSIPTCVIVSSMFFTMGNQEFLHCISLLCQGKSKRGIFQRLSKNAYNAIAQINYGVTRCPCSFTLGVPNHFRYPL
jgi:hypothetical protein